MPYVALQSMIDQTAPHGWRFYDRLHYLPEVSNGFIDALLAGFETVPTPQAHVVTGWMGGAIDRVAPGETAFGHRGARAFTWIIGCSGDAPVGPVADWVRRVWDDTARFATGGVYVNALDVERPVRDAYADEVWERRPRAPRRTRHARPPSRLARNAASPPPCLASRTPTSPPVPRARRRAPPACGR
jgi:hypothetical protein